MKPGLFGRFRGVGAALLASGVLLACAGDADAQAVASPPLAMPPPPSERIAPEAVALGLRISSFYFDCLGDQEEAIFVRTSVARFNQDAADMTPLRPAWPALMEAASREAYRENSEVIKQIEARGFARALTRPMLRAGAVFVDGPGGRHMCAVTKAKAAGRRMPVANAAVAQAFMTVRSTSAGRSFLATLENANPVFLAERADVTAAVNATTVRYFGIKAQAGEPPRPAVPTLGAQLAHAILVNASGDAFIDKMIEGLGSNNALSAGLPPAWADLARTAMRETLVKDMPLFEDALGRAAEPLASPDELRAGLAYLSGPGARFSARRAEAVAKGLAAPAPTPEERAAMDKARTDPVLSAFLQKYALLTTAMDGQRQEAGVRLVPDYMRRLGELAEAYETNRRATW